MKLRQAVRSKQHPRISIGGPPGAGKTWTSLRLAASLAQGGPIGVIDSENGSAELYQGEANQDGGTFDFQVIDLSQEPGQFSAENYIDAIDACQKAGMKVIVIDSLSHAWAGPGGILEYVDTVGERMKGNKFAAWKAGTPLHNRLIQRILSYPGAVICTMRCKVEYVQDGKNIRKVGMQPIQREGTEFEFTLCADVDQETHGLTITKSRISRLADRRFVKAGADLGNIILNWMNEGSDPVEPVESRTDGGLDEPAPSGKLVTPVGMPELPENTEEVAEIATDLEAQAAPLTTTEEDGHSTWFKKNSKWFFASLGKLGFRNYPEICDFCTFIGRPRPSQMNEKQGTGLVAFLGQTAGADKYAEFLATRS